MKLFIFILLSMFSLEMKSQNVAFFPCSECNRYFMACEVDKKEVIVLRCAEDLAFDIDICVCNFLWAMSNCQIYEYITEEGSCNPKQISFEKHYSSMHIQKNCVKEIEHKIVVKNSDDINFLASIGISASIGEEVVYTEKKSYAVNVITCREGGSYDCEPYENPC